MAAYATVEQLEARWRKLTDEEKTRAAQKLEDASVLIEAESSAKGVSLQGKEALLALVSCEMVKRSMIAPTDQAPVTQENITVGVFSSGLTYANPTGDLYLTSNEKRILGIKKQRISSVSVLGDA